MPEILRQESLTQQLTEIQATINKYQNWTNSSGPHSHKGKFYRRVIQGKVEVHNELFKQLVQEKLKTYLTDNLHLLQRHTEFSNFVTNNELTPETFQLILDQRPLAEFLNPEASTEDIAELCVAQFFYFFKEEVEELEKPISSSEQYAFDPEELMVSLEIRAQIENGDIEPYPLSNLQVEEINASLSKLKIKTSLLPLPRLSHVTAEWIEFDSQMIQELEHSEQLKILATVLRWEKENGKNVRRTGAIGELKK